MRYNSIFFFLIFKRIIYLSNCCPTECLQCNGNSSYCLICASGYYLSSNICYQCTKPCADCSINGINCSIADFLNLMLKQLQILISKNQWYLY
ncbi:unnamed protein product [Paramecium pentaurelia]|uniref:Uncharacterized protein n=1 Tax=Paramecium pentaurelia TaxID=43138 RepID=A0A8S1YHU1_9CILI|nr:unnamed protein product [Paramecium pentaurelia]